MSPELEENFAHQARGCEKLGSPFTAGLCRLLAERLNRATQFGARIFNWSGDPGPDALALRACGALHALARSGREPALSAAYPPAVFDMDKLWTAIADVLERHDDMLTAYLDSPPQTNEVARSQMVLGTALIIANRTGLPIDIYEIGASAGLNLGFDRYNYDLGQGQKWTSSPASLEIACEWHGNTPPLDTPLKIVERYGCDRNPLDPASKNDAERLMSYVWADQAPRLERLGTALKLAAQSGVKVEKCDAAEWAERHFNAPPRPGAVRMLIHTIVWQYLPQETQARIMAALQVAASHATPDAPVAHFAFENDMAGNGGRMDLTLWPGGETITLGRADFHGRWAEWA